METIRICINYLLLSVMICYYCALKKEIFNNSNYLLSELLELNYNSIMLIFQQIKNNISPENEDNIFLPVLIKIYKNYSKNSIYVNSNNFIVSEKIHKNSEKLDMKIKNLLSRKKYDIFKMLYNFSINLRKKNYIEINEFFIKYILHEENLNGSLFSTYAFISSN